MIEKSSILTMDFNKYEDKIAIGTSDNNINIYDMFLFGLIITS